MKLEVKNRVELSQWINERINAGRDMVAIKGAPPPGATYDDGSLIINDVNVGWRDLTTGETIKIEYEHE